MPRVYVFIAEGFEEVEALTPIDVLRRCGADVVAVSIATDMKVRGAHGVEVECNQLLSQTDFDDAEALIIPGGMPGAKNLSESRALCQLLKDHAERGTLLCAICAAPFVLGINDLLKGKRATCYPGFETYLHNATYTGALVESDGQIITAKGPGAAAEFAFAIADRLAGTDVSAQVREQMFF